MNRLDGMEGYAFERFYLTTSSERREVVRELARTALQVQNEARKHDLIHVQGEAASAVCLPSLALRPSVVTLHGLNLLRRATGAAEKVAKANLRLAAAAASRVICVSESERDDFIRSAGRGGMRRAVLIRNGIIPLTPASPEERAAARAALEIDSDVVVGAWLAGLDQHKDPLTAVLAAIETARSGTPFVLFMAGDGALRADLERVAAKSGVDAVRIVGFRADVRQFLAAADLFVLSSRREGLSFALLEALSMGLPAVVSDGPGNPDAVGDAGVVVPTGDVRGFAEALERLSADRPARLALGEIAQKRVAERFDAREMVRRTREVYGAVLGRC